MHNLFPSVLLLAIFAGCNDDPNGSGSDSSGTDGTVNGGDPQGSGELLVVASADGQEMIVDGLIKDTSGDNATEFLTGTVASVSPCEDCALILGTEPDTYGFSDPAAIIDIVDGSALFMADNNTFWVSTYLDTVSVYDGKMTEVPVELNPVLAFCPNNELDCDNPGTWTCAVQRYDADGDEYGDVLYETGLFELHDGHTLKIPGIGVVEQSGTSLLYSDEQLGQISDLASVLEMAWASEELGAGFTASAFCYVGEEHDDPR